MKLVAVYRVYRVNPYIPVKDKGKPPQYALIEVGVYKEMRKGLGKKCLPIPVNGGLVACTIRDEDRDTDMGTGVAVCSLSDQFKDYKGIQMALDRARAITAKRFINVQDHVMLEMSKLGKTFHEIASDTTS